MELKILVIVWDSLFGVKYEIMSPQVIYTRMTTSLRSASGSKLNKVCFSEGNLCLKKSFKYLIQFFLFFIQEKGPSLKRHSSVSGISGGAEVCCPIIILLLCVTLKNVIGDVNGQWFFIFYLQKVTIDLADVVLGNNIVQIFY